MPHPSQAEFHRALCLGALDFRARVENNLTGAEGLSPPSEGGWASIKESDPNSLGDLIQGWQGLRVLDGLRDYVVNGDTSVFRSDLFGIDSTMLIADETVSLLWGDRDPSECLARAVLAAADARLKLDNALGMTPESPESCEAPLTLVEIAHCAGVAEKTVRNASFKPAPEGISTQKDGHFVKVSAPEALRWLSQRRDWRPSQWM